MDRASVRLVMRLLKGEGDFETTRKALKDPKGSALEWRWDGGESNYRYWGLIQTPRKKVAYCWSCNRNIHGYFLGWRQVYDKNGRFVRDQWVARKSRKRLKFRQKRLHDGLIAKGGAEVKR